MQQEGPCPDEIANEMKGGEKVSIGVTLSWRETQACSQRAPAVFFKHTPGLSVPQTGMRQALEIKSWPRLGQGQEGRRTEKIARKQGLGLSASAHS